MSALCAFTSPGPFNNYGEMLYVESIHQVQVKQEKVGPHWIPAAYDHSILCNAMVHDSIFGLATLLACMQLSFVCCKSRGPRSRLQQ